MLHLARRALAQHIAPPQLPAHLDLDEPPVRVALRVSARARRFTLRLEQRGPGAVLTMPIGVSLATVQGFLHEHRRWLTRALESRPADIAVGQGTALPIDGTPLTVNLDPNAGRTPRIQGACLILAPGGPVGPRLQGWLKTRARARLVPALQGYAAQLGRPVAAVALRDTRSRWGSCSSTGRVGLSWRLAMAPPAVQAYVAAHEAAHLVEMNHSPRYWAVLEGLMPDYAVHRAWLRTHGRQLQAYDFGITSR
ncbi:MAG: SprT family zinc-dependent metalloprotease [Pseudomonadota bacterium]